MLPISRSTIYFSFFLVFIDLEFEGTLIIVGAQMSYHKFNEFARRDATVQRLKLGGILALISDAGMPGISDPGTDLVCIQFIIFILFYFSDWFLSDAMNFGKHNHQRVIKCKVVILCVVTVQKKI